MYKARLIMLILMVVQAMFAFTSYASELIEPTIASNGKDFYGYFQSIYKTKKDTYNQSKTNSRCALDFAKACFEFAEFATNKTQRAELANEGIEAAKNILQVEPDNGEAHYWLAMNLAQLSRTKGWSALKIVKEMEHEYLRAIELIPSVEYAGPHRLLGLLYRDAPGWPISIGSKQKSKYHLEQAVKLAPEFPDNQIFLIESYLQWGEKSAAVAQYKKALPLIEKARNTFTNEYWNASWADWTASLKKLSDKLKISN